MHFSRLIVLLLLVLGYTDAAKSMKSMKVKGKMKVRAVSRRYCVDCGQRHYDKYWYNMGSTFTVCRDAYLRISYAIPDNMPRSWAMYQFVQNARHRDNTGCLCHSLIERLDLQALRQMFSILSQSQRRRYRSLHFAIFAAGFAICLYFAAPISTFINFFEIQTQYNLAHHATIAKAALALCQKMYAKLFVVNGVLHQQKKNGRGISALKNPSERRSGLVRCQQLVQECDKWWEASKSLAGILRERGPISIAKLLQTLADANMQAWTGDPTYANVRMARALVFMVEKTFADSGEDWEVLFKMSKAVKDKVLGMGLEDYDTALEHVAAMRRFLELPSYSLEDLVCYICLLSES